MIGLICLQNLTYENDRINSSASFWAFAAAYCGEGKAEGWKFAIEVGNGGKFFLDGGEAGFKILDILNG